MRSRFDRHPTFMLAVTACLAWGAGPPAAQAGDWFFGGGGHHHGHDDHDDDDAHILTVGPAGVGYGYYSRNFGLQIGPGLGDYGGPYYDRPYGYGGGGYYAAEPVYAEPAYREPVYSAPPPVVQRVAPPAPAVIATNPQAAPYQQKAENAFRRHDYPEAARQVNHAAVEDPDNGRLHLFLAQALFAVEDYPGAALATHHALSLLDRSDWGFVVKNYHKFYTNNDYVAQMNLLIDFLQEHPDAAYAHFVRGYHYVYLGHADAARRALEKAVTLQPRDTLAGELLVLAGGKLPVATAQGGNPPTGDPSSGAAAARPVPEPGAK